MFSNDSTHIVWARVRNGMISVWNGGEEILFKHAYGRIVGISYKMDEWNGTEFERVLVHLVHDDERWILSMRTDSQYFRTMCNYLVTAGAQGVLYESLRFAPTMNEKAGKKYSALYISHGDKFLHAYYRTGKPFGINDKHIAGLPDPNTIEIGGRTVYDFTPQVEFYKAFLSRHFSPGWGDSEAKPTPADAFTAAPLEDPDDLPF